MASQVKIGIAGCGPAGTQVMFAPILRHLQNGRVTALMDPDPAALAYMRRYCPDAATFSDYDEFLARADMDAVLVASPVYVHCEQVVKAARAGKHVLCEKPLARTVGECDAMIQACREAGVVFMVAFMKRFDKSFRRAKELIEAGELGEVFLIRCDWSWPTVHPGSSGWRVRLLTWGGIFQDHGSHTIDLCRWWIGDVETVSGEIRIVHADREVEDTAIATLRHVGGGISLHQMTAATHKPLIEYYLLDGTRASLEIQYGPGWSYISTEPFRMTLYQKGRTTHDLTLYNQPNLDDEQRAHGRYLKELEHFCDCVLNGTPPLTPGEDGRAAIMAINAVFLSSWRGEKIRLPLLEEPDLEAGFRAMRPLGK
jgi:UDP-N-acetyl-2-amino-2-deoxyglucuronate dehydrogenase